MRGNTPELGAEMANVKPTAQYQQDVEALYDLQATSLGVTEAENLRIEAEMQKLMTSEDTHICIRLPEEALKPILGAGRFKSQFETGTSRGILDTSYRATVEHDEMGYSKTLSPAKRPIYGMLFNYKQPSEVDVTSGTGWHYGNIVAIMKPSVKAHATVTAHDSLDGHGVHIPAPMLRPSRYMFATSGWGGPVFKEAVSRVKAGKSFTMDMFSPRGYGYAEAQIHGGHGTVSNIEHLILTDPLHGGVLKESVLFRNMI